MLIVALVMAVIGLAALVTAVVTSNEAIAWVCIGASVIGVVLLIVDALRERRSRDVTPAAEEPSEEYPDEPDEQEPVEQEPVDEEPAGEPEAAEDAEAEETTRRSE
jgi:hypothetical protein